MSFRRIGLERGEIGRATLSGLVATVSDYAVFATLASMGSIAAVATLVGCLVGGIVNFTVNRAWAFRSRDSVGWAAVRYGMVSGTSAVANALLVALTVSGLGMSPHPAWILARALVFVSITYPLFRGWVFPMAPEEVPPGLDPSLEG